MRRPVVAASYSASSQPGSTMQSLLSTATTGARASSIPVFQPRRHASVLLEPMHPGRAAGRCSGEPLSTTTTSVARRATSQTRSIVRAAISASSGVRLQTGIVTVRAGSPPARRPLPPSRGAVRRRRSPRRLGRCSGERRGDVGRAARGASATPLAL